MSDGAPRVLVPASTEVLLAERHAAFCTAYRRDVSPEVETPSIYALARNVTRRGYLELYRARG